jgi:hypothetical protein
MKILHFTILSPTIYTKEKLENANLVGINLELDAYKREIDKIESEKLVQEQSIRKSKIIVGLFVLIVCILIVLLLYLIQKIIVLRKSEHKAFPNQYRTLSCQRK